MKTKLVIVCMMLVCLVSFSQNNLNELMYLNIGYKPDIFTQNKPLFLNYGYSNKNTFTIKSTSGFVLKNSSYVAPYTLAILTSTDEPWQDGLKYNMKTRTLISAGLFVPMVTTGFILSAGERPPNTALLTLHKLSAVSNLVFLDATVLKKQKTASLTFLESFASISLNVCFLGTIATGGMLSMNKQFPKSVNSLHSVTPWLTILSSGALLYLLNSSKY